MTDNTGITPLLSGADPFPVLMHGVDRDSPFLLVSDHAGQSIPESLNDLGVEAAERGRHIGWDIGIDGMGRKLAEMLGAVLIEQVYSRLVIDCNRAPGHPTSIVEVSDGTVVPANAAIDPTARLARECAILDPYHARIVQELDARVAAGRETFLIALHSFTPVMAGNARIWQVGVLHNHDPRFGHLLIDLLREEGFNVGDNEPYALTDTSDYTVPVHGEKRGIPHLELEIRQDLIEHEAGQQEWAERMARLLPEARVRYHARFGTNV